MNKKNKKTPKSVFDQKNINDISNSNPLDDINLKNNDVLSQELKEDIFPINTGTVETNNIESINKNEQPNLNDTFFQKFEKSKKAFIRDKRKNSIIAKKTIFNRFKSLGITHKLENPFFLKTTWIIFICSGIFMLIYSCVVLGFLAIYFNGVSDSLSKWTYINVNVDLVKVSVISSAIILAAIVIPYIYLVSSWFVGINKGYKSVGFFIFNLSCLIISLLCTLMIIGTSSIIFNFVIYFQPIVS